MIYLVYLLSILTFGSSGYAWHEHKALAAAHTAAMQAQAENAQAQTAIVALKAAESTQTAAQAKEDSARKLQEAAHAAKGQNQQVALTAAKASLTQTPPAVAPAIKFVDLAASAGDTPTAETTAQGLALALATEAAQAQEIADLKARIGEQKATIEAQDQAIVIAHANNLAAVQKIGDLTGAVAVHVEKEGEQDKTIATVTDQSKAWYEKYMVAATEVIYWVCAAAGAILAGLVLWHYHLALKVRHAAEVAAHAVTQTKLATITQAHTDLIKSINPPTT